MRELELIINRLIDFGLLTPEEEKQVKIELLNIEKRLVPKTQYIEFIEGFNHIIKKKYQPDMESRELFYQYEMTYNLADRLEAVKNAQKDPYVFELNPGILQPKWILKPEFTAKYINYIPPKKQDDEKIPLSINKSDPGSLQEDEKLKHWEQFKITREKIYSDDLILERWAKALKLPKARIKSAIIEFFEDCYAKSDVFRSHKDYLEHCYNWIKSNKQRFSNESDIKTYPGNFFKRRSNEEPSGFHKISEII